MSISDDLKELEAAIREVGRKAYAVCMRSDVAQKAERDRLASIAMVMTSQSDEAWDVRRLIEAYPPPPTPNPNP